MHMISIRLLWFVSFLSHAVKHSEQVYAWLGDNVTSDTQCTPFCLSPPCEEFELPNGHLKRIGTIFSLLFS